MDIRKIGIILILIGIVFTVVFIDNQQIFVPALTVTMLGFFITIIGFISEIRKRKIINDRLDEDIGTILQPLITKYSNLNKQYREEFEGEEYAEKRLQLHLVKNRTKCNIFFQIYFNVHFNTTRF